MGERSKRLWPIAPGHHSDASSSTGPYEEEEGEEGAFKISVTGGDTDEEYRPSKSTQQWKNTSEDSMQSRCAVTSLTPFHDFSFCMHFLERPPFLPNLHEVKVTHPRLVMDNINLNSAVCFFFFTAQPFSH